MKLLICCMYLLYNFSLHNIVYLCIHLFYSVMIYCSTGLITVAVYGLTAKRG